MRRRSFLQFGVAGTAFIACRPAMGAVFTTIDNPNKFTREALYYNQTPRGIKCHLCPNRCNVTISRPGDCRTKVVQNNKLVTTAYGNPYYVNTETPENESLYHFKPGSKMLALGTAGCTSSCMYCIVWSVSQKSPAEVTHLELFPEQAIKMCNQKNIKTIAYSYTEPVAFYEYMLDTAKMARENGIGNVWVSNGSINDAPLRELAPYLDAAVIDVKAFSDATYQKLTGNSIFPIFNTLKTLKELNVWTEITHLLVPGWTDDFDLIKKMCEWMMENGFGATPLHFNKFKPMYRLTQLSPTPEQQLLKARDIALSVGLQYVYIDNLPEHGSQQTVCPKCNAVVVERKGMKGITNHLQNGKCKKCQTTIPGVW